MLFVKRCQNKSDKGKTFIHCDWKQMYAKINESQFHEKLFTSFMAQLYLLFVNSLTSER